MKWFNWLPWRYILRRVARSQGFIDPIRFFSLLQKFAQPSEVAYPMELIRAGVVFHARGLLNTKVIQQNLDWIWPYWVERQFNPNDASFIPRGFSITHINLSHRNWTAVGLPDCSAYPIIDPAGLVTPFYDGYSIDAWVFNEEEQVLLPSKQEPDFQRYIFGEDSLRIVTEHSFNGFTLNNQCSVVPDHEKPYCQIDYHVKTHKSGWLALCVRPYNPEGISFINSIQYETEEQAWLMNKHSKLHLTTPPEKHAASNFLGGDVFRNLLHKPNIRHCKCDYGLATGAVLYRIDQDQNQPVSLRIDLSQDTEKESLIPVSSPDLSWKNALNHSAQLQFPDKNIEYLYNAAIRSLILHCPNECYPGPYTYKRFWFRDAAFILHAMIAANMPMRVKRLLDQFPNRQTINGYFSSQDGEWDSNGEVLWILQRYCELTGESPNPDWKRAIISGARWIHRKRLPANKDRLEDGLLPAGFSAEHLGNNDFYYWDDFWSVAGLHAADEMCQALGDEKHAIEFREEAQSLHEAISTSLDRSKHIRQTDAIPASPYRRMDSGAIGSVVAGYPLNLWDEKSPRLLATVEYLLQECSVNRGFFQNMIHSGINAYLTLHLAQTLLRAGDTRYKDLIHAVADLSSPTGQWPEAINPRTGGGCMGDGHHVWASAEWVMMIRNLFVREEGERLILASGLAGQWLEPGEPLKFGPTLTPFGNLSLQVKPELDTIGISWDIEWRSLPKSLEIRLPGYDPVYADPAKTTAISIERNPELTVGGTTE